MGNYLAIATVTSVFAQRVCKALNNVKDLSAVPVVTTKRPEKQDGQLVGAYLYLYMVEHDPFLRNDVLPTHSADGSLIREPQVALKLKYHISFYGRDSTLEAQRMMGSTIVDLHAAPLMTSNEIKACLEAIGPHDHLAESTLHDQQSAISIKPVMLSLEEMSKMWATFFQMPHEASLIYEVSGVLMQRD